MFIQNCFFFLWKQINGKNELFLQKKRNPILPHFRNENRIVCSISISNRFRSCSAAIRQKSIFSIYFHDHCSLNAISSTIKGKKNRGGCPPSDFSLFISADAHQSFSFCLSFFFISLFFLHCLYLPESRLFFFFFIIISFERREIILARAFPIDISNGFSGKMEGYHHYIFPQVEKKLTKTSNL